LLSKLPYARNLANWFSGKSSKLLLPDVKILRLKCTKFAFGWGSGAGAAYSAPPDHLAGFGGPTSEARARYGLWVVGKGRERETGREGQEERSGKYKFTNTPLSDYRPHGRVLPCNI